MAKYNAEGEPVRIMPVTRKALYNYNISTNKKLYQCGIKTKTFYFYPLSENTSFVKEIFRNYRTLL